MKKILIVTLMLIFSSLAFAQRAPHQKPVPATSTNQAATQSAANAAQGATSQNMPAANTKTSNTAPPGNGQAAGQVCKVEGSTVYHCF